jgi:hypothetical protein
MGTRDRTSPPLIGAPERDGWCLAQSGTAPSKADEMTRSQLWITRLLPPLSTDFLNNLVDKTSAFLATQACYRPHRSRQNIPLFERFFAIARPNCCRTMLQTGNARGSSRVMQVCAVAPVQKLDIFASRGPNDAHLFRQITRRSARSPQGSATKISGTARRRNGCRRLAVRFEAQQRAIVGRRQEGLAHRRRARWRRKGLNPPAALIGLRRTAD